MPGTHPAVSHDADRADRLWTNRHRHDRPWAESRDGDRDARSNRDNQADRIDDSEARKSHLALQQRTVLNSRAVEDESASQREGDQEQAGLSVEPHQRRRDGGAYSRQTPAGEQVDPEERRRLIVGEVRALN